MILITTFVECPNWLSYTYYCIISVYLWNNMVTGYCYIVSTFSDIFGQVKLLYSPIVKCVTFYPCIVCDMSFFFLCTKKKVDEKTDMLLDLWRKSHELAYYSKGVHWTIFTLWSVSPRLITSSCESRRIWENAKYKIVADTGNAHVDSKPRSSVRHLVLKNLIYVWENRILK